MSKTFSVGRVTVLHKGEWDESTTYSRLDIVTHDGSSYFVLADVTGVEPPDDTYYAVVAEKGDAGSSVKSIEQTVQSSSSSGENVLTITLDDGTTSTVIITNGGQGETGNGIEKMEQTESSEESLGENVWVATTTDGESYSFTVLNGEQGERGNLMWPEFEILEASGELTMYVPDDYNGPEFSLNDDGELEVTYDNG